MLAAGLWKDLCRSGNLRLAYAFVELIDQFFVNVDR